MRQKEGNKVQKESEKRGEKDGEEEATRKEADWRESVENRLANIEMFYKEEVKKSEAKMEVIRNTVREQ